MTNPRKLIGAFGKFNNAYIVSCDSKNDIG